ncbi:MAG: glycosyltransferase family 9 protein [Gammaproteobacteria bacterium]|nr:glycosyltransferase family 9 protein [Gammaproteobacteria bacterium]MDH5274850.1 glycosyltransferase family 9 protein [Gammaproteobacteria bacterium]
MTGQNTASAPAAVCLIRLSAIGDCCHTLPVVRTLQAAWPHTRITWIIGRTELGLLEGASGIEFITFDKRTPWASLASIRRQLAGRHYPLLLHMHASMRANLVSRAVRADVRLGFDRARARDYQWLFTNERIAPAPGQHAMDALFSFAGHLGIRQRVMNWDFAIGADDRRQSEELASGARPLCVISPCSSQRFRNYRNWSVGNYATVMRHLIGTRGARVVLTGGPSALERRYGEQLQRELGGPANTSVINLIGQTRLKELFAILQVADLVICPDSGPAHMATAAGVPVVGLYATSNRHRTGPYFCQRLVVDGYPEAVQREFNKPVAALRWGERVRDPGAMDLIQAADVIARVDAVLDGRLRPDDSRAAVARGSADHPN